MEDDFISLEEKTPGHDVSDYANPTDAELEDAGFQLFWQEYPKKLRKQAARAEWKNVWKEVPQNLDLIHILERQAQSEQWKMGDLYP